MSRGDTAAPDLAEGTRDIHIQSAKGLRITTRCETVEQFVATYHRICEDTAIFIPNTSRSVGAITQFTFDLTGGRTVLVGMGAVVEEFTTRENRFGAIGVVIELQHLARASGPIFDQLLAARTDRNSSANDHAPAPIFARTVTGPVTIPDAVKALGPMLANVQIPNLEDRGKRAKTVLGVPAISKLPAVAAFKVPVIIRPRVEKPKATPPQAIAKPRTESAFAEGELDAMWDTLDAAIPEPLSDQGETVRDVLPYALHHAVGNATPATPEVAQVDHGVGIREVGSNATDLRERVDEPVVAKLAPTLARVVPIEPATSAVAKMAAVREPVVPNKPAAPVIAKPSVRSAPTLARMPAVREPMVLTEPAAPAIANAVRSAPTLARMAAVREPVGSIEPVVPAVAKTAAVREPVGSTEPVVPAVAKMAAVREPVVPIEPAAPAIAKPSVRSAPTLARMPAVREPVGSIEPVVPAVAKMAAVREPVAPFEPAAPAIAKPAVRSAPTLARMAAVREPVVPIEPAAPAVEKPAVRNTRTLVRMAAVREPAFFAEPAAIRDQVCDGTRAQSAANGTRQGIAITRRPALPNEHAILVGAPVPAAAAFCDAPDESEVVTAVLTVDDPALDSIVNELEIETAVELARNPAIATETSTPDDFESVTAVGSPQQIEIFRAAMNEISTPIVPVVIELEAPTGLRAPTRSIQAAVLPSIRPSAPDVTPATPRSIRPRRWVAGFAALVIVFAASAAAAVYLDKTSVPAEPQQVESTETKPQQVESPQISKPKLLPTVQAEPIAKLDSESVKLTDHEVLHEAAPPAVITTAASTPTMKAPSAKVRQWRPRPVRRAIAKPCTGLSCI